MCALVVKILPYRLEAIGTPTNHKILLAAGSIFLNTFCKPLNHVVNHGEQLPTNLVGLYLCSNAFVILPSPFITLFILPNQHLFQDPACIARSPRNLLQIDNGYFILMDPILQQVQLIVNSRKGRNLFLVIKNVFIFNKVLFLIKNSS